TMSIRLPADVDLGPTDWNPPAPHRSGWWRPAPEPVHVFAENPVGWVGGPLSARLFVGLNVGDKPRWTLDDVVAAVADMWRGGASFLGQRGIWRAGDSPVEEDSVQVVLFDEQGHELEEWVAEM